jgi:hypothetical protein
MKHASMYLTQTEWILTSMSQTTAGVWVANLVIHRLATACLDEELGGALLESLAASALGVPHPNSLPGHQRQFREKLGVLSFERFMDRSHMLAVHCAGQTTILTPHRNRGHRYGYEPLSNKVTIEATDAQTLGKAIRQCAERCQSAK